MEKLTLEEKIKKYKELFGIDPIKIGNNYYIIGKTPLIGNPPISFIINAVNLETEKIEAEVKLPISDILDSDDPSIVMKEMKEKLIKILKEKK